MRQRIYPISVVLLFLAAIGAAPGARADRPWQNLSDCGGMTYWDITQGMCEPLAMPPGMEAMPMKMAMLHGNVFGARIWEQGPRGRDAWASPSMVMGQLGTSVGHQYLSADLMLTAEKWMFPDQGYPLLTQIGEVNSQGAPFIDAQHPHSSPIMGLTFADTISLGAQNDYLKLSFAPRGESTDGPVAFMHRATGMVNPDAPLGHHIGQDVGHISSTVIAGALRLGDTRYEISGYHGSEPSPESVDLPVGKPDSVSFRLIEQLGAGWTAMASAARVNAPEPGLPVAFETRYSASAYWVRPLADEWTFYDTFIYGTVTQFDHADRLSSFAEEFLFQGDRPRIWGRLEALQRTPAELGIASANPDSGEWISELTLGYTHRLVSWQGAELGLGGSVTKDLLAGEFVGSYGGNPWTGKIFLQLAGMKMWGAE